MADTAPRCGLRPILDLLRSASDNPLIPKRVSGQGLKKIRAEWEMVAVASAFFPRRFASSKIGYR